MGLAQGNILHPSCDLKYAYIVISTVGENYSFSLFAVASFCNKYGFEIRQESRNRECKKGAEIVKT